MSGEDQTLPLVLSLSADSLMFISLPLNIRLLWTLARRRNAPAELEAPFHTALQHVAMRNVLYAFINLFIQEPANYGFFPHFYIANAFWMGPLYNVQVFVLVALEAHIHFVIAANRYTAIFLPTRHKTLWRRRRATWACGVGWAIGAVYSLPLIYPIDIDVERRMGIFGMPGVAYIFHYQTSLAFQIPLTIIGVVLEVTTFGMYFRILLELWRQVHGSSHAKQATPINASAVYGRLLLGATRMTLASVIMCIGGWMIIVIMVIKLPYEASTGFRKKLITVPLFYALLRICTAVTSITTPLVVITFFPTIRRRFVPGRRSTQQLAASVALNRATTHSSIPQSKPYSLRSSRATTA